MARVKEGNRDRQAGRLVPEPVFSVTRIQIWLPFCSVHTILSTDIYPPH